MSEEEEEKKICDCGWNAAQTMNNYKTIDYFIRKQPEIVESHIELLSNMLDNLGTACNITVPDISKLKRGAENLLELAKKRDFDKLKIETSENIEDFLNILAGCALGVTDPIEITSEQVEKWATEKAMFDPKTGKWTTWVKDVKTGKWVKK